MLASLTKTWRLYQMLPSLDGVCIMHIVYTIQKTPFDTKLPTAAAGVNDADLSRTLSEL